ncbi:MAG: polymerase III delta' subunit protein [Parcubacteria group bacterium GW2011_GWA2_56_21]|nr:MAG: polymerase III delta' subunit protein [Parcubacteria group bacterium GW2011_GWA2_56_21]
MRLAGNTHLVVGGPETVRFVLEFLEREGVAVKGNPDLYVRTYKQFGVEEARELRERAGSRPVAGPYRVFVVATPSITTEAQNALLKILEEPPAGAMFFFIIPAPDTLLATLRSRAQMLALGTQMRGSSIVDVHLFLAATPQRRLDMLKVLLEKDEDEKRDLGNIIAFLSSLEKSVEKDPDGLRAVYRAQKYIGDRGALVKPLLEQIALLVPKA